jgi:hypothetical protein
MLPQPAMCRTLCRKFRLYGSSTTSWLNGLLVEAGPNRQAAPIRFAPKTIFGAGFQLYEDLREQSRVQQFFPDRTKVSGPMYVAALGTTCGMLGRFSKPTSFVELLIHDCLLRS